MRAEFEGVLRQLEIDLFAPSLRVHALSGKLRGKYAASLTYSHRIVLMLVVVRREVILLDVGTHDEVYRA
jgi:mRNA-degrading endonuclease YafQ of YafQ-DinJ toxin-antitoxin module